MIIQQGCQDIFVLPQDGLEAVCVTTNGLTRRDGAAVMGRGIALAADQRFHMADKLGGYLSRYGNRAFNLGVHLDAVTGRFVRLLTFPTKHDWRNKSDLELIKTSARQLVGIADKFGLRRVYLPRPGCGLGGLDWETEVRPAIEDILDDRFVVAERALHGRA